MTDRSRPSLFAASTGTALTIGYTVLDVVIEGDRYGHAAGGTAANIAANLNHLGWSASVAASYGYDQPGIVMSSDLKTSGVKTDCMTMRAGKQTPVVIHEVLDDGRHRRRFKCPSCGRKLPRFRPISLSYATEVVERVSPDVLVSDRVSKAAVLLARAVSEQGGLVVFEPSFQRRAARGSSPQLTELTELADLVKFSAERIRECDLPDPPIGKSQTRVRTLGSEGAEWCRGNGSWRRVEGHPIRTVDAGGAGDWMTAALLSTLGPISPEELDCRDLEEPLRIAQAVAAVSCGNIGARGLNRAAGRHQISALAEKLLEGDPIGPTDGRLPQRVEIAGIDCPVCLLHEGVHPKWKW